MYFDSNYSAIILFQYVLFEIYFHTEQQSCKDNNDNICIGCLGQYDICHKLAYERCIQLGLRWCPVQGRTLNRKTNTRNDLDDSAFEFGLRSLLQNDGLSNINKDLNSNITFSTNEQIDFGTSSNQQTLESNE